MFMGKNRAGWKGFWPFCVSLSRFRFLQRPSREASRVSPHVGAGGWAFRRRYADCSWDPPHRALLPGLFRLRLTSLFPRPARCFPIRMIRLPRRSPGAASLPFSEMAESGFRTREAYRGSIREFGGARCSRRPRLPEPRSPPPGWMGGASVSRETRRPAGRFPWLPIRPLPCLSVTPPDTVESLTTQARRRCYPLPRAGGSQTLLPIWNINGRNRRQLCSFHA